MTSIFEYLEDGPFAAPRGLWYDVKAEELWVTDTRNHRIGIFTADGMPVFSGSPGAEVREPFRIVIDGNGRILVLDRDRSRVAILDWRARYVGPLLLSGLPERPAIGALAVDEQGNLYVGEDSLGEVQVYDRNDKLRFRFGAKGGGEGEFQSIADIAIAGGRIAVVDHRAISVQLFDRRGHFQRGFGSHGFGIDNFSLPSAVTFDSKGRILVVDSLRHEIKLFSPNGEFLDRFGGLGTRRGQIAYPSDIAITPGDRIFVAERGGNRVQVFDEIELEVPRRTRRSAKRVVPAPR